jgi:methylase of polypeptide subunit release factors
MSTEHFSPQQQALLQLGRALQQRKYRFITPTPLTHSHVNGRPQNAQAYDLAGVFGWSRPFAETLVEREIGELLRAAGLLRAEGGLRRSAVRWSNLGEQMFVHSSYPTEQADAVFFGPDTYRFVRAIDAFLSAPSTPPIRRAVDIGCGAGPGALCVALARPTAQVLALDINAQALGFTQVNAALAGAKNVEVLHSNLLDAASGAFDLIIANPPYMLDSEQRAYRDGGGELGVGLSLAILDAALPRLAPGGSLLLYTGVAMTGNSDPFLENIRRTLAGSGLAWRYEEVDPDVFGEELLKPGYEQVERIAAVLLTVTRTQSAI